MDGYAAKTLAPRPPRAERAARHGAPSVTSRSRTTGSSRSIARRRASPGGGTRRSTSSRWASTTLGARGHQDDQGQHGRERGRRTGIPETDWQHVNADLAARAEQVVRGRRRALPPRQHHLGRAQLEHHRDRRAPRDPAGALGRAARSCGGPARITARPPQDKNQHRPDHRPAHRPHDPGRPARAPATSSSSTTAGSPASARSCRARRRTGRSTSAATRGRRVRPGDLREGVGVHERDGRARERGRSQVLQLVHQLASSG